MWKSIFLIREMERPAGCSHPHVWRHFRRTLKDGSVRTFRIQDVPEDMEDEIIQFMIENFTPDAPISVAGDLMVNEKLREQMKKFWKNFILPQKLSLVCFENGDFINLKKKRIVGVNFLMHVGKDQTGNTEEIIEPPKIRAIMKEIDSRFDTFAKFGVNQYLGAVGLSVCREYRGMNISKEILLARTPLCDALGYKVTETIFSSAPAQAVAIKAGFELQMEITLSELKEKLKEYKIEFPENFPVMKIMTKTFVSASDGSEAAA